jgi:hypothetical protein
MKWCLTSEAITFVAFDAFKIIRVHPWFIDEGIVAISCGTP